VTFTFGLFPPFASNNALPDWSIGLEMQFYAVFPFLMLTFRRVGYLVPLVLATIVYTNAPALFGQYLVPGSLLHFGQPSFLPLKINVFLIGMLLGEARFAIEKPETVGRAYQLILLAVGLCLFHQHDAIRIATVLFILWICASQARGPISFPKMFSWFSGISRWRMFQFMADTSYAVYLIHLMALTVISAYLPKWAVYVSASPQLKCWILLAVSVPVVYAMAAVIHQFVEKPGIRLGKKAVARIA
jgi:peptidoglycan/LPS O-acetylase OafA/YrhL